MTGEKGVTQWAGLLEIRNKRVLMVKEFDKDFFMLPGGRVEAGEEPLDTLRRELQEELGVRLGNCKPFGEYDLPGRAEGEIIHFIVFTGEIVGDLRPEGDVEKIEWVDSTHAEKGIRIGSITSMRLFPMLKEKGLIN